MFDFLKKKSKVELITMTDGTVKRITKTTADKKFQFKGEEYGIHDFLMTQKKVYFESYHNELALYEDVHGRLILYYYNEEMCFDGDDRVDEMFNLVKDEQDADDLCKDGGYRWGRVPYVYKSENGFVSVHEIAD